MALEIQTLLIKTTATNVDSKKQGQKSEKSPCEESEKTQEQQATFNALEDMMNNRKER